MLKSELEVKKTTYTEVKYIHPNNTHRRILGKFEGYSTGPDAVRVVFDNPDLRGGFTQVPNLVLCDPLLSGTAKLCYSLLLSYAWHNRECWPSQNLLAEHLCCTTRTTIKALKELQKHKLIAIERPRLGKPNIYHICKLSDGYLPKQYVD